jgi:hypothetical protein
MSPENRIDSRWRFPPQEDPDVAHQIISVVWKGEISIEREKSPSTEWSRTAPEPYESQNDWNADAEFRAKQAVPIGKHCRLQEWHVSCINT